MRAGRKTHKRYVSLVGTCITCKVHPSLCSR